MAISNVRPASIFLCYRFLSRLYFHVPILVPFLHVAKNLEGDAILVLVSLYGAGTLCSALFNLSPGKSLLASDILTILGVVGLVLPVQSTPLLAACEFLLGVAYGIASGADYLVFSTLGEISDSVKRLGNTIAFPAVLTAALFSFLLYSVDTDIPLFLTMVCRVLTFIIALASIRAYGHTYAGKSSSRVPAKQKSTATAGRQTSTIRIMSFGVLRGVPLGAFVGTIPVFLVVAHSTSLAVLLSIVVGFNVFGTLSDKAYDRTGLSSEAGLVLFGTVISLSFALFWLLGSSGLGVVVAACLLGLGCGAIRPVTTNWPNMGRAGWADQVAGIISFATLIVSALLNEFGELGISFLVFAATCGITSIIFFKNRLEV